MNHKLTVRFAGICTHFRYGVVPGVPHRVVLPDASRFTTGFVSVDQAPVQHPILYYLMPHFAQLEAGSRPLDVPPFTRGGGMPVKNGDVRAGIRLQVLNAIDRGMTYSGDATPSLASFVHNYTFSTDVVLNGRATVYFDLYGGAVHSIQAPGGASQTFVEVTTDGPPELLVTPLTSSDVPVAAQRLRLGEEGEITLNVKNLEAAGQERSLAHQCGAFDFLLHYLTASGDIPVRIKSVTPGMEHENLVSATRDDLALALAGLSVLLEDSPSARMLTLPDEVTPSCSDSGYP
jgi:hypothetical protein